MNIEISRETEARLADEARRLGVSVDALVEQLIKERAALIHPVEAKPELPMWHLGVASALHRRDLYDHAR